MNGRALTAAINKRFRFVITPTDSYTLDYTPSPLMWTPFKNLVARNVKELEPHVNDYWSADLISPWQELDDAIKRLTEAAKNLDAAEDPEAVKMQLEQLVRGTFNILSRNLVEQETHTEIRFPIRSTCISDKRFPEMQVFMDWASARCAHNESKCDSEATLRAFVLTVREPSRLYYRLDSSSTSEMLPDLWALKKEIAREGKPEASASELLKLSATQLKHVSTILDSTEEDFRDSFASVTKDMANFRDEVIDWEKSQKQEIEEWRAEQEEEIRNLERLYREKLALEEPKRVWDDAAKKHTIQAICWTIAAVLVAVTTIWKGSEAIHWLFAANLPRIPLLSSSFLAIALITFCVYTIRVFVKIALSNSHLAAAYRQKASMTYFYLSLMEKEKAVSDEERALILNSLFSSVDTGLVKPSDNKDLETLAAIAFKRA